MDVSGTITQLTMEYIKPEYPVYKMKVFISEEHDEAFRQKTFILEHNDKAFPSHYIEYHNKYDTNYRIDFDDAIIHTDFINQIKENENLSWFDGVSEINYGVIYCKRIA